MFPLKVCTKEDFTKRNFELSKEFEKNLVNRLCPDVDEEFEDFYEIRNIYENET